MSAPKDAWKRHARELEQLVTAREFDVEVAIFRRRRQETEQR